MGYITDDIYGWTFVNSIVRDNPLNEEVDSYIRYVRYNNDTPEYIPDAEYHGDSIIYRLEPKHSLCVVIEKRNARDNRSAYLMELNSNEEIEKFLDTYIDTEELPHPRVAFYKVEKGSVDRMMNRRYRRHVVRING